MNFYSHIFSSHFMIFRSFDIPKECIRCPNQLRCISRHVERRGEIMRESRISPPLTEENVHRIFLEKDKKEINISQYMSKTRWMKLKFVGFVMLYKQPPGYTIIIEFTTLTIFVGLPPFSPLSIFFATLLSNLVIRSSSNSPQILRKYRNFALTTTFHLLRCLFNAIFYSRLYEELLVTSTNLSKNEKALRVFAPDNNVHLKDWKWKEKVF